MPVHPDDAAHLLRRSGFGVTPAALAELTQLADRNAAVDRVLDLQRAPTGGMPIPPYSLGGDQYQAWVSTVQWWTERMRTTPLPIVEKMTLFWHGHFTSSIAKIGAVAPLATQNQLLRANALGNYHTLAQAIALDPAMLYYLDNWMNSSFGAQENFARELMELFTLGQGMYTQDDVVNLAKAWTGHSLDETTQFTYLYRPTWHDDSVKQLFTATPRAWTGPQALTEIIKGSRQVPAARWITAKLFSFFVYPAGPNAPAVIPLADSFRASGWNIYKLLKEMFRSTAFWGPTARRALVRSPIEWMVATLQATGLTAAQTNPQWWMEAAGQMLLSPPNVAGWGQNGYWLSTSASWSRAGFAANLRWLARDAGVLASTLTATPADAVQQAFTQFGITDPAPTTRAALEAFVTRARAENDTWSVQPNLVLLTALSPDFQVA